MKTGNLLKFLPFIIFALIALTFIYGMWGNRADKEQSPLLGKPAPAIMVPEINGGQFELKSKRPILVNFFASWCVPCRAESQQLLQMAGDKNILLIGIAYEDEIPKTQIFLEEEGNPYEMIGVDLKGGIGTAFGLTGVPETYIINPQGVIIYKHKGAIEPKDASKLIAIAMKGEVVAKH